MSKKPKIRKSPTETLSPSEHATRLHRRAQRAESEVVKLKRQLAGIHNAGEYWKRRYDVIADENRRHYSMYSKLWRIVHTAEGKFLGHEDTVKALQARLRPSLFRRFVTKLGALR